jgi:hypothetical protein
LKNKRDEIIQVIKEYNKGEDVPHERLPLPDTLADDVPYDAKRSEHVILALLKNKNPQEMFENHRSRTGEELDPKSVKNPELKDYMTLYLEDPAGLLTIKVNRWKYPQFEQQLINARIGKDWFLIKAYKAPYYGKSLQTNYLWVIDPE